MSQYTEHFQHPRSLRMCLLSPQFLQKTPHSILTSIFKQISYVCFWTSHKWDNTICTHESCLFCLTHDWLISFSLLCSHYMKYTMVYLSILLLVDTGLFIVFSLIIECCCDYFSTCLLVIFWHTPRSCWVIGSVRI